MIVITNILRNLIHKNNLIPKKRRLMYTIMKANSIFMYKALNELEKFYVNISWVILSG